MSESTRRPIPTNALSSMCRPCVKVLSGEVGERVDALAGGVIRHPAKDDKLGQL